MQQRSDQADLPLILAITGASGAVYAVRLLEVLVASGRDVHLMISPSGAAVIQQELQRTVNLDQFDPRSLLVVEGGPLRAPPGHHAEGMVGSGRRVESPGQIIYHHYTDFMAPPASGSFLTGGMVVCPCSGSTLSAIAMGASNNLIQRAADVHLKERRKLILVPRETPLSLVHLDNMRRAVEAGAVILPAMPGWYHGVKSVQDVVDFVVARILDQLGFPHELMQRWGEAT
jgi:4-hydroxy-3-polyprenylbenzoate decarboxylase